MTSADYSSTLDQIGARPPQRRLSIVFSAALVIFFATSSMYIFPSGQPQPADFLLFGACVMLVLFNLRLAPAYRPAALMCFLFALYVMVLSFVWVLLISHTPMLIIPAYFWYNAFAFFAILFAATRNQEATLKILKIALIAGILSLLAQLMLGFEGDRQRQTGGFNNPNQMGYFALCLVGILMLLRRADLFGFTSYVVFLGLASVPLFLSFSSTAIGGFVFAMGIFVLSEFRKSYFSAILSVILVAAAAVFVLETLQGGEGYFAQSLEARIGRLDGKISGATEARGWARPLEYPQYLFFGAGEGARFRFGPNHQHQLHSKHITLLFSYGIIGTALFIGLTYAVLYRAPWFFWGIMTLPHLYGVTHQSLRQTLFWILMAVILVVAVREREQRRQKRLAHG